MKRLILLAFCLLVLLVAGCGGTSTATLSSNDAAVVGSEPITKDQFQSLMDRAKTSYVAQKRPFPKPGSTEYEQLKGQAVTFLIQRAEVAQEGEGMGIKITDEEGPCGPALRTAEIRRQLRHPGEEVLEGSGLCLERRQVDRLQGTDRPGLRQGRLQPEERRAVTADPHAVRLPHHRGAL